MIRYDKISKKKTKVTEVDEFQNFTSFSAHKEVTWGNCARKYVCHATDMALERLTFTLKNKALYTPDFYLNGIRIDVASNDFYATLSQVEFNSEDNSYYFRKGNISEGDVITVEYITKDKIEVHNEY